MMTVITEIDLDPQIVEEWDRTMQERLQAAEGCEGWIAGQILRSLDRPGGRVIVGVWEARRDWEAWHEEQAFQATRERLRELGARSGESRWFETLYEGRR